MSVGWALPGAPRMRLWEPASEGGGASGVVRFAPGLTEVGCAFPALVLSAVVVWSSAVAEDRAYAPPPSTTSTAAAASSRGRIGEVTGSPGWPPDELHARRAVRRFPSWPATLDRARGVRRRAAD